MVDLSPIYNYARNAKYGSAEDRIMAALGLIGEANREPVNNQGQLLDIMNNRAQVSPQTYWRNTYGDSIAAQLVAGQQGRTGQGGQFTSFSPGDPNAERVLRNFNALVSGDLSSLSPLERAQATQAVGVANDYFNSADNPLRGSAQGATYYQTTDNGGSAGASQNAAQQKYGFLQIGSHRGTQGKGNEGFIADPAEWAKVRADRILPWADRGLGTAKPPGRPTDRELLEYGNAYGDTPLNQFSNSITDGLESAGRTLLQGFYDATTRLPTTDEFGRRMDAIKSGASGLWDQLAEIGRSPEAAAAGAAGGFDPMRHVIDEAYQQATGRDADDPSLGWAGSVLQNQGGQSLFNALQNSQEGKTHQLGNFYQDALNRPIDQQGLQGWLSSGKSLPMIEAEILKSPEAQSLGIQPDEWARTYSPDILAALQQPGAVGTQGPGVLTPTQGPSGTTPTQDPRLSEYGSTIQDAFNTILHRAPDAQGQDYFDQQLTAGTLDPSGLQQALKASPEYLKMHPEEVQTQGPGALTPTEDPRLSQYRSTLGPFADEFAKLTGRPLDATGGDYFTQEAQNGTPQSILEAQLLTAPEVQTYNAPELTDLVNNYRTTYGLDPTEVQALRPAADQFASILGRPVDTPTLQYWDSQINGGASMPSILAQMLQAPEVQAHTGDAGYQNAVSAFGSQFGINPADYLGGMLAGPSGVTGLGNALGANQVGSTPSFNGMVFNPNAYLAANPDVANSSWASNPLQHFEQFGYNEGRSLGSGLGPLNNGFNAQAYLAANPDVAMAGLDPLAHYLMNGAAEGRQAAFSPDVGPYAFGKFSSTSMPAAQQPQQQPLGSGITYNNGSVQHGGVDIGPSGLFDPVASENAYLNTQVDQINQGAQHAAQVAGMLTGYNPATGYTPMPVFGINGTNQSNSNVVGNNQLAYLNNVNTALGIMAPQAPSGASFMPPAQQPSFGPRIGTAGLPF